MRDTTGWYLPLYGRLRGHWREDWILPLRMFLQVELGLRLQERVAPGESARAVPVLLTGYPFLPGSRALTEGRLVASARHLLLPYKNPHAWLRALDAYALLPQWVRGYALDEPRERAERRNVSVAHDRWTIYDRALDDPPPHRVDRLKTAGAGAYLARTRRGLTTVHVPEQFPVPGPVRGHDLKAVHTSVPPLMVTRQQLLDAACWMDHELQERRHPAQNWEWRLRQVHFERFRPDAAMFEECEELRVDRLLHLVGMVSSGKSTLMEVLAVWAAREAGLRVTLVVGDVVSAVRRSTTFRRLGIEAVPILGHSNRRQQVERMHRVLLGEAGGSPLEHADEGFDFLSTACALDGLREGTRPFLPGDNPCADLLVEETDEEGEVETSDSRPRSRRHEHPERLGCPLFGACQQHRASRALVTAPIWIATPASLVYTRVPAQVNPESLRYAELVYRMSDLLIIDEADAVQVHLDTTFSPSESLIGGSRESWFDDLDEHVGQELRRSGRAQLGEATVSQWVNAFDVARAAGNRLYALLNQEPKLRRWIERDYFTEWTLAVQLAHKWTAVKAERPEQDVAYGRLMADFEAFIQHPVGGDEDNRDHPLAALARRVLVEPDEEVVRGALRAWLLDSERGFVLSEEQAEVAIPCLEFVLVLAVLANRLEVLIRLWRNVEGPLNLDGNSLLFHRPPEDFAPVVPEAPMGNQLGFQYLASDDGADGGRGELRFFRCMGVGRWLMLHLHELFALDGVAGPNVLLLSGTSWAGSTFRGADGAEHHHSSPAYHVQVPVGGVLRTPEAEVAAIAESRFRFLPLTDAQDRVIRVVGKRGGDRRGAIRDLLAALARRAGPRGQASLLERELEELRGLDRDRARILLLVGSYEEARHAQEDLVRLRSDWREQVLRLRADTDEDDTGSAWVNDLAGLRRGEVERFADTGATFLIAPLMAVERGHNILNEDKKAAIGAAYFLVRPNPRPDDISFAIHSINHWAVEEARRLAQTADERPLAERGRAFRRHAYGRWRTLLRQPMVLRTMEKDDQVALTWSHLVSIWQVVGRLVRGGCPAHVYFCDSAFADRAAAKEDRPDDMTSSLLIGMREVLRPYFEHVPSHPCTPGEQAIAQRLYQPLYTALAALKGVSLADI